MKLVFSRKGFDSTSGGGPSPIVNGKPISLPIPASDRSQTTFADRGLGELALAASKGRVTPDSLCHDDPMFQNGRCWFGQHGSAQGHLARQGVGIGDVFLFFGLFAQENAGEPHHRIFGYMLIEAMGAPASLPADLMPPRPHPHLCGAWDAGNHLYIGRGTLACAARASLRLTREGGPLNRWRVPEWLCKRGMTYHGDPQRWHGTRELDTVRRGQEFVCDIGRSRKARDWLDQVIAEIEA